MEMSKVTKCNVTECDYNIDNKCHARAITIGNSGTPKCDTLCKGSSKTDEVSTIAGVGACKTASCKANKSLECSAPEIQVGHKGSDVICLSYSPK